MKTSSRRRMMLNDTVPSVWFPYPCIGPGAFRGTATKECQSCGGRKVADNGPPSAKETDFAHRSTGPFDGHHAQGDPAL